MWTCWLDDEKRGSDKRIKGPAAFSRGISDTGKIAALNFSEQYGQWSVSIWCFLSKQLFFSYFSLPLTGSSNADKVDLYVASLESISHNFGCCHGCLSNLLLGIQIS